MSFFSVAEMMNERTKQAESWSEEQLDSPYISRPRKGKFHRNLIELENFPMLEIIDCAKGPPVATENHPSMSFDRTDMEGNPLIIKRLIAPRFLARVGQIKISFCFKTQGRIPYITEIGEFEPKNDKRDRKNIGN